MKNNHIVLLRKFTLFDSLTIKYLSEGANGIVYDIGDKYIAKFSKPQSEFSNKYGFSFDSTINDNKILKIIQGEVSFCVPVYDWICVCEHDSFIIYKKISGVELNLDSLNKYETNAFLTSFAQGLCAMHSIKLNKFNHCRLEKIDLKKRFAEKIKNIKSLGNIISKKNLALALKFISEYMKTISKDNIQTIVHGDLTRPHIYINPRTKKLSGLIDFGNIKLYEPSYDFSLLNVNQFEIAYKAYSNKKLLGKNKADAIFRQQAYHLLKILSHIKNRNCAPESQRQEIIDKYSEKLEFALKSLKLL